MDDTDSIMTDIAGEMISPAVGSIWTTEDIGAVKLEMQLPVTFLLPTSSDDPSVPSATVHVFMDINVTAEVIQYPF